MFTKKATDLQFFSQYWEKAEFPFEILPKLGDLRIAGFTTKVIPILILDFNLFLSFLKWKSSEYDVWLLLTCRVMDALVSPPLQVLLQLQRLLELMQVARFFSWCIL